MTWDAKTLTTELKRRTGLRDARVTNEGRGRLKARVGGEVYDINASQSSQAELALWLHGVAVKHPPKAAAGKKP